MLSWWNNQESQYNRTTNFFMLSLGAIAGIDIVQTQKHKLSTQLGLSYDKFVDSEFYYISQRNKVDHKITLISSVSYGRKISESAYLNIGVLVRNPLTDYFYASSYAPVRYGLSTGIEFAF